MALFVGLARFGYASTAFYLVYGAIWMALGWMLGWEMDGSAGPLALLTEGWALLLILGTLVGGLVPSFWVAGYVWDHSDDWLKFNLLHAPAVGVGVVAGASLAMIPVMALFFYLFFIGFLYAVGIVVFISATSK